MRVVPFRDPADVPAALALARAALDADRVIAYPTETVYGFGCRVSPDALANLGRIKRRASGHPYLLLVADRDMIHRLGVRLTATAAALAETFWPGPLTLVLPSGSGKLPDAVRGSDGGVAVRLTAHAGMRQLIEGLGYPITSTSVNRSGEPPARTVEAVGAVVGRVPEGDDLCVLDGGPSLETAPSTLVDCTGDSPRLLRAGAIPVERIEARVGRVMS